MEIVSAAARAGWLISQSVHSQQPFHPELEEMFDHLRAEIAKGELAFLHTVRVVMWSEVKSTEMRCDAPVRATACGQLSRRVICLIVSRTLHSAMQCSPWTDVIVDAYFRLVEFNSQLLLAQRIGKSKANFHKISSLCFARWRSKRSSWASTTTISSI